MPGPDRLPVAGQLHPGQAADRAGTAWTLRDYLVAKHGVYIRECGNKLGMTSQFMRLVVRPAADVDRLIDGMLDYGRQFQRRPATWTTRWTPGGAGTELRGPPDNLIQYPTHRTAGAYAAPRRAVAR